MTIALLLLTQELFAQSETWTFYAPAPPANCLAASGNTILAGTDGAGIVHYDTAEHRTYYQTANSAIPSDTIKQIAIDAEGHWWIHYESSISTYEGSSWQTWTVAQIGLPANTLVRTLKPSPDSSLYAATSNGVAIFKNGAWQVLNTANSGLPSNNVWDVAFNPDGKIYYATSGSGIVLQDGTNWASFTTANTGISFMNSVFGVAVTTDGTLWALGGTSPMSIVRLVKFDGVTWNGFTPVSLGIVNSPILRTITAGNDGTLWLTGSGNVSVLSNQVWTHYYQRADIGCRTSGTSAPAIAGNGDVWIQNSCQLAVFDGQDWHKPGTGLPGPDRGFIYNGIAEDSSGGIWMGTAEFGEYVTYFKGDIWQHYYPTDLGASNNNVAAAAIAGDALWLGLDNAEILQFKDGAWSFFDTCASVFTDHITIAAATAPNGDQWFVFENFSNPSVARTGLARYSPDGKWQFFTPNNYANLQFISVNKIVFDASGSAWMSTGFQGLLKYDGNNWDTITANNSALPGNRVLDLAFAPDGNLWACTENGLGRFDGQNWTSITTANSGLPSNKTARIAFDKAGGMYVGYAPDPSGTTGATVAVLRDGVWSTLTPPGWENNINKQPDAFFIDSKNRLWFAELAETGVYRYDPMLVGNASPDAPAITIRLSPNPCTENCTVQLGAVQADMHLRVSNALGQTLWDTPLNTSGGISIPIEVNRLQPGMYWISLWQANQLRGTTSFVKM